MTLRSGLLHVFLASAAAMAAMCLLCAMTNLETTVFGLVAGPFIVPSVILFLLLEAKGARLSYVYSGFFLPVGVLLGLCCHTFWELQQLNDGKGSSDGGDGYLSYFVECYAIGVVVAFIYVRFRPRRFQYGLKSLFLLTLLVAVIGCIAHYNEPTPRGATLGVGVAAVILSLSLVWYHRRERRPESRVP